MTRVDFKKIGLLLMILTAVIYGNTALNDFPYDDYAVVFGNYLVRDWANFFDVISQGRGVRAVTYMLDYSLFGEEPLGYHLHSIIWQILAVLLTYLVSLKLVKDGRAALIVSLLFACHPLHVEAVASITNRKETLCFVFFMGALLSFINIYSSDRRGRIVWSALSILFFLLAIKSKQVAVTLPAFLILYELCFVSRGNRKILSKRFIYLKVALVVILLSLTVWKFSQYIVIDSNMYYFHYLLSGSQLTYSHILYNIVTLFTYYVKNILFPLNLLPDYSVLSSKLFLGKTFVLSLSFFVFYLYLICRFYRRHKVVSFGLIWFLLNYLVISPLNSAAYPLADRYIYLPSYGISLAIGVVLNRGMANLTSGRNERLYMAALFTCLFCFSVLTINYNRHWKNNSTLWEYGLRKNPASFPARFNVATEYINKEMFSEAESALMKIPALDPRSNQFFDKNIILIDLYYHRGDVSDAFDLFKANVRRIDGSYNPGLIYPHIYKYASLLSKHGYIKDALRAYDILFREGYRKDIVLRRMKNLRNVQGENRSYKIENLKKAIIANPEDIRPRVNLGILYYEDFSYEMAERELLEALKLDNNSFEAHYDLGLVYKKTERFEEAAMEFEKAALLRVKVPPVVYDNLGLVYKNLGRDEDSIEQFRMAINVQSDFAISYKHLGDAYRRVGNNAKAVGAYNSFLKYWDGDEYYKRLVESELRDLGY